MSAERLLAQFGEQQVIGFFLVLARVSPLFLVAPLFSSKIIPARARSVIAVGLAIGIAPLAVNAGGGADLATDVWTLGGLIVKELLVGLGFSFTPRCSPPCKWPGSLLDTFIGFSFGALVDPVTGTNGGVLNQLYALVGVMIFVAIDGDAWVIQGLARSYEAVPLTSAPDIGTLVEGAQLAFSGSSAPRSRSARRCCSRSSSATSPSA